MIDFKELSLLDIKLMLQSGRPFYVKNIEIPPFTLQEIIDAGYVNYRRNLDIVTTDVKKFAENLGLADIYTLAKIQMKTKNMNTIDFLTFMGQDILANEYLKALRFILKDESLELFKSDSYMFVSSRNEKAYIITSNNIGDIVLALKYQHNLIEDLKSKYNPSNDRAREIIEKIERAKKRLNQTSDEDEIDISDIIASVASKHPSLNYMNIFQLTFYQLIEAYKKLIVIDQYDKSFSSAVAGAKDVELIHWTKSLNSQ